MASENFKKFVSLLYEQSSSLTDQEQIRSTIALIKETIPNTQFGKKYSLFVKDYFVESKAALEIALLTSDKIIHDFASEGAELTVTYKPLTSADYVRFNTFHNPSKMEPNASPSTAGNIPYRVELDISDHLSYSVEGNRRQIRSLINFGQACLSIIHLVK